MFEAAFDIWSRLQTHFNLFVYGMDTVDKIMVGCTVISVIGVAFFLWEVVTWSSGSSST